MPTITVTIEHEDRPFGVPFHTLPHKSVFYQGSKQTLYVKISSSEAICIRHMGNDTFCSARFEPNALCYPITDTVTIRIAP